MTAEFEYDLCVLGVGRVGLPLALSLIEAGKRVVGLDHDARTRELINSGVMPFHEPGYDELIARKELLVHADPSVVTRARALIITVGTPLHNHIETDLGQVRAILEGIAPHLRPGQLVCLRSTVAPHTTRYVHRWIERSTNLRLGKTLFITFCPERIVEGKAKEELRTLPQVIGAEDDASFARAAELFSALTEDVLRTDFVSAELVKLFNNVSRYVNFALANHLALVADTFGANIFEIRELANHKYPRQGVASPGFTAGTCLRKDFGMLNEWAAYPDLLLSAWKMNEFMPLFLVNHLKQRTEIFGRRVAVLGYTFKAGSDDTRDSLAPKLLRYIERELPEEVRVSEPHIEGDIVDSGTMFKNWTPDEALAGADCVFVATNHEEFGPAIERFRAAHPEAWVADLWNSGSADMVFYRCGDAAGADS